MAQWSDPRVTGAQSSLAGVGSRAGDVAFDAGLRSHMLKVYNYMASGVLLTGVVAMLFAQTELAQNLMTNPSMMSWVIILSPLVVVLAMSFGQGKFLMGLSMARIFMMFTGESIAQTFFATSAAFAGLSLWAYTTKKDISGWGSFLVMGMVGLIVASIVNIFLGSDTLHWVISAAGVLIFAGLTAYDTQRIKSEYFYLQGPEMIGKAAVMAALTLYLDFINMFQFLLSFLGNRE
jgi:uncharacterized protein